MNYHNNPADLGKFIDAQNTPFGVTELTMYEIAVLEIKRGLKLNHWIWYVFPQIEGLSENPSYMTQYYAIPGLKGAVFYLNDYILRARLMKISRELLALNKESLTGVMPNIDIMKVRSSITLFYLASVEVFGEESTEAKLFMDIKNKYFKKIGFDDLTLKLLYKNGEIDTCIY